ncbi:MAG: ABC transporter permease [Alkaliphilus sp.]
MKNYLIRRLIQALPVLLGITIIVFTLANAAPGNPTSNMMDPTMTAAERARILERFGMNQSVTVRYFNWMREIILHRNLGHSTTFVVPVSQVIGAHMWNTFYLSALALAISLLIGIPAGVISATKQYSIRDGSLTVFSLIGISMPSFFFGLLLIKWFAIDRQIFPMAGMSQPGLIDIGGWTYIKNVMWHSVLPAVVLGLGSTAGFMRYTRSSMLEVIRQDYIRTARAKGLGERVVIYKHALRNAMIPIITLLGFWIPGLFSGAFIVESIFAWPGMGTIGLRAISDRDYSLLMGVSFFLSFLTLLGNLTADILYGFADPRIKYD